MAVERCGFLLETCVQQEPSDTLHGCTVRSQRHSVPVWPPYSKYCLENGCKWLLTPSFLTTSYPFQDTEPPVIDRCRSPPTVQAADIETAVVWEVPQFSDNSGMSGPRFSDGSSRGWFILLLLCSTALHPLPPPMMDKQDLFRLENGDQGQALGVHLCM